MNLLNKYKAAFNIYYRWAYDLKLDNTPEFTALVTITFFIYINILSLILIFRVFFLRIGGLPRSPEYWFLILLVIIGALNYLLFIYKKKMKPPKRIDTNIAKKENRLLVFYMLVSIVILVGVSFIRFPK